MDVMTAFHGSLPIWSSNNGRKRISKNSSGIMLDICSGCRIIYIVIDDSNQVKEWTCSTNMTSAFVNDAKNLFMFHSGTCQNHHMVSFPYAITNTRGTTMLIQEKVSVNVIMSGKTYRKFIMVTSDGCYDSVSRIVADMVKQQWAEKNIEKFFWNYAWHLLWMSYNIHSDRWQ